MRNCIICTCNEVIGKEMYYGKHAICFSCMDKVIYNYILTNTNDVEQYNIK